MSRIKGKVKVGDKTKELVKEILPGEIAVINHENIDEVAAKSLLNARVKAVINLSEFMSGDFPNRGPKVLLSKNILMVDKVKLIKRNLVSGDIIHIDENYVFDQNRRIIGIGRLFTKKEHDKLIESSWKNMKENLNNFIENTMVYAYKEKEWITDELELSKVNTCFENKECVVVTRGSNFKDDLNAIKDYILATNPKIIGVDGGADAVIDCGLRLDIVLGDMDSVTDRAISKAGEILVHSYPDGNAPGEKRIKIIGYDYKKIVSPGTSEDLAFLVAYQLNSRSIIAIGTHTSMVDFYEKNRKGMASTFLTRIKVGDRLIDAKGVNELLQDSIDVSSIFYIFLAAGIPFILLIYNSEKIRIIFQLIYLRLIQGY